MDICFFIPSISNGGAERVLINLINNFPLHGYNIYLKTLFKDNIEKISRPIEYSYVFPFCFRGNVKLLQLLSPEQLYKIIFGKTHYDIVISYLQSPTMRIVAGCADKNTVLINWIHNEFHHVEELSRLFRNRAEFFSCMNRYNCTVHVAKSAMLALNKIVPSIAATSTVIYNTVESDIIQSMAKETTDTVFNKKEVNLISVGRFTKAKAFERLIRITGQLRENGINAHLYLLGSGEMEQTYVSLAKSIGISGYVTLLGFQDNPYKFVARADLFVCSSLHEGYSTAVTEALIVGTPVITTDCSGMDELLDSGKYGIITYNDESSLYRSIYDAITQEGALQELKEKAKARSLFFNKEKTVGEVVELFEKLIKYEK